MLGSFTKAALAVLAILVTKSNSLKCDINVESSLALSLANKAHVKITQLSNLAVGVKFEENCDGVCVRGIGKFYNESGSKQVELAGCQSSVLATNGSKTDTFFALKFAAAPFGTMEYGIFFCNTDNCNAAVQPHRDRLVNIQKTVNFETDRFKSERNKDLQCRNEKEENVSCSGICSVRRPGDGKEVKLSCDELFNADNTDYGTFLYATVQPHKHVETEVTTFCSSDICNAEGSDADKSSHNIRKIVREELNIFVDGHVATTTKAPQNDSSTAKPDVATTPKSANSIIGLILPVFISMVSTVIIC